MKRNSLRMLLTVVFIGGSLAAAYALSTYMGNFNTTYPASSLVANCNVCHTSGFGLNSYANDYAANSHSFAPIENRDSDGDGFSNIAEITAGTFPGDAASKPAADTSAPAVTLTMPSSASSLTVAVTVSATDDVGVTGYMVNENATAPAASATGWSASAPTNHTFASAGAKTLYAWAKDAAGNVGGQSKSVTISLPDTSAPAVTLTIPASATSLTVAITVSATDNTGVAGYMVNESATTPAAGATGWSASPPTSYTFASAGAKTLHAWAKDAAGNVGGQSKMITITIPVSDTTAPAVTLSMPSSAASLTVAITVSATDNVGVVGYLVNESATAPAATAGGWTASAPASYTFASAGARTLYAWAKDAAGNIGGQSKPITITIPVSDATAPAVTLSMPSSAASLTVAITVSATDNVGVTGYMVNESATAPAASAGGWTASAPASYTFAHASTVTLYAWAKDAAGNVGGQSKSVTITIPVSDLIPPSVTAFSIPATSSSLTVTITSLSATDNVGVAGYLVSENPGTPSADSTLWKSSVPTSYAFSTAGDKLLYAWAKDAAGNVSAPESASTTISTPAQEISGMEIWKDKWFQLTIRNREERYTRTGYLNLVSWDAASHTLHSVLYTKDDSRQWQPSELLLHYTSGTPLQFSGWFDYAEQLSFVFRINAAVDDNGNLRQARLRAAGINQSEAEADSETESENDFSISGNLASITEIPSGFSNPQTDDSRDASDHYRTIDRTRARKSGATFNR